MAKHDFDTNVAAKSEIDRLIKLSEQHKDMITELHDLIKRMPGAAAAADDRTKKS
jgi:hypothetical protein